MTEDEENAQHDADRAESTRNLVILAGIIVFAALMYWVVTALAKANATTQCISAGYHNCVPLDTSGTSK